MSVYVYLPLTTFSFFDNPINTCINHITNYIINISNNKIERDFKFNTSMHTTHLKCMHLQFLSDYVTMKQVLW